MFFSVTSLIFHPPTSRFVRCLHPSRRVLRCCRASPTLQTPTKSFLGPHRSYMTPCEMVLIILSNPTMSLGDAAEAFSRR